MPFGLPAGVLKPSALLFAVTLTFVFAVVLTVLRGHRSRTKLRALIASMDDLILILDRSGRHVEIVTTGFNLLTRPRHEMIGRRVHDVMPHVTADFVVDTIQRALDEKRTIEADYSLDIAGRLTWFSAKVSPPTALEVIWVARDITSRKLTEEALQRVNLELERCVERRTSELNRSEALYRGIIEQAEDVVFTLDSAGIITSLNPAFEKIVAWPAEDWIGRNFLDLVCEDARAGAAEAFASAATSGASPVDRVAICGPSRRIIFEVSLVNRRSTGGESGFLGFARDITQRARAEKELRRSERQLADSQRIAKLGSWENDLAEGELRWSDGCYRLFEIERTGEPMTYERFLDLLLPEERSRNEAMQQRLIDGVEADFEMRIRVPSGAEKILHCMNGMERDASGRPRRLYGSVRDVTDKKRAEQLLRDSQERYHLLGRATNDAAWDRDLRTNELWWGEGVRTLFGYDIERPSFERFAESIHPDDMRRVLATIDEAIACGEISWTCEYRLRRADGTWADILDRAYIVRDADTTPLRMVGAAMDITERKIMHEQLAQANRVAGLGRIAASIAHEFNNVLMGIQPHLEIIQRRPNANIPEHLGHILQSVRRGKRVTDEILRFTRPLPPALQCVDVQRFLTSWEREIRPVLGFDAGLTIECDPELYVSADPLQIAQVLTNLALNARDAMREQGGYLTVVAERVHSFSKLGFAVVQSPDRFVHFRVTDDGTGMTRDQLKHLFEPLFSTKKGGTGLGLAVSYQIVSRHEGLISAESEPGAGTTFHLLLPAALPSSVECASRRFPTAATGVAALHTTARVLIVEDEEAVSAGIRALLELDGIESHSVDTGAAAVPAIADFHPDAIILDVGLPDMDGVDVYRLIAGRWPDLPVLFSSGHAGSVKLEEYLRKPNVGLIVKPYDLAALQSSLGVLLNVRAGFSPPPAS